MQATRVIIYHCQDLFNLDLVPVKVLMIPFAQHCWNILTSKTSEIESVKPLQGVLEYQQYQQQGGQTTDESSYLIHQKIKKSALVILRTIYVTYDSSQSQFLVDPTTS